MQMGKTGGYILPGSILIAALIISGAVFYSVSVRNGEPTNGNTGQANVDAAQAVVPSINADDVVLGDPNAPITMIEFGDFQCSFCGRYFSETEPLIRKNYVETGKVKVVHKDFPFLGPESLAAANAVKCAKDHGKFWQYYDSIYKAEIEDGKRVNNGNLNEALFIRIAENLNMNVNEFASCFRSRKYDHLVQRDIQEGMAAMGQRASTPTFFINGRMIQGAQPYQMFVQVFDSLLEAQQ